MSRRYSGGGGASTGYANLVAESEATANIPVISVEHKDLNHIYYNATLTNNTRLPAVSALSATSTTPILDNPRDFEMSVVRFDVNARSIPIAIVNVVPPVNLDPTNPPVLVSSDMYATLTVGGFNYTSPVTIYPQGAFLDPKFPLGGIFRFQALLDDINKAYATSYALIPGPPAGSAPPQFIWNPQTELIELFVDPSYMFSSPTPPFTTATIQIWASVALARYLSGFSAFLQGYNNPDFKDILIEVLQTEATVQPAVGSRQGLPYSVSAAPANLLMVQQEAKVSQLWNSARTLLVTSNMMPVRSEYVPTNNASDSNFASSSTQTIITDFLIPSDQNVLSTRTIFQYLPTAEYRMVDLISTAPIYTIDIAMTWTDFLGNVYPLILVPNATLSLKILFRRKGVTD